MAILVAGCRTLNDLRSSYSSLVFQQTPSRDQVSISVGFISRYDFFKVVLKSGVSERFLTFCFEMYEFSGSVLISCRRSITQWSL
jgi:hypothetical protein